MKCYKGNKPYIFVSYSHKDTEIVYPIIEELLNRGYRIWYDEGIEVSEEWPEIVAKRLYEAESVIFFISDNFCESRNCKREVNFVVDKNKDAMSILINNPNMSLGLEMQLNTYQSLKYTSNESMETFIEKLLLNKVISKDNLIMGKDEFEEFTKDEIPNSGLINQMIIAIGIIKYDGKVLMTKRQKEENKLLWGFPATMLKPEDDMEARVVKETYLETGARTKFIKLLGTRIHPDTKVITHYCALEYLSGDIDNRDDYENSKVEWVELSKYKSLITSSLFDKVEEYLEE